MPEGCPFCSLDALEDRRIQTGKHMFSIVSSPRYRENHCLVIPKRRCLRLDELSDNELVEVFTEAGRIATCIDNGYGTAIFQKYAPSVADGAVKQAHLHIHIVPLAVGDSSTNIFGTPRKYSEFYVPTNKQITATLTRTRPE